MFGYLTNLKILLFHLSHANDMFHLQDIYRLLQLQAQWPPYLDTVRKTLSQNAHEGQKTIAAEGVKDEISCTDAEP